MRPIQNPYLLLPSIFAAGVLFAGVLFLQGVRDQQTSCAAPDPMVLIYEPPVMHEPEPSLEELREMCSLLEELEYDPTC
jgi:hypothetical protein